MLRTSSFCLKLPLAVIAWLSLLPGLLLSVELPIAPYAIDTWTTADGLPQNSVTAMAQTTDGYLWMATFTGLVRFDGMQFTVFDQDNVPALRSSQIRDIYADRQGRLWIMDLAGGICRMEGGRFTREGTTDGMHDCFEDRTGTVWFSSLNGDGEVLRWDGKYLGAAPLPPGCPSNPPLRLWHERDDRFWVMAGSDFGALSNNVFVPFVKGDFFKPGNGRMFLRPETSSLWPFRGAERDVWLKRTNCLQRIRGDGSCGEIIALPDIVPHTDSKFFEEKDGSIWVLSGTRRELWRRETNGVWMVLTSAQGLYKSLRCIFEDREHSIWVGTDGGGVHRLRRQQFRTLDDRNGLSTGTSYAALEDAAGKVWVGAYAGGLKKTEGDHFVDFKTEGKGFDTAEALFVGSNGMWAAFASGTILKIQNGQTVSSIRTPYKIIFALHEDHQGTLWIGHSQGLARYSGGTLETFGPPEGFSRRVLCIAADRQHHVWFGSDGDGLHRFDGSGFTHFKDSADKTHNSIRSLLIDTNGTIWIGTSSGGIGRFKDEKFAHFGMNNGFPDKGVNCILEDDLGYLWTSGSRGIVRIARADLESYFSGGAGSVHCDLFGERDGLGNRESRGLYQPHGFKAHDGRLWFCTLKGVSVVNPNLVQRNHVPPLMAIQEIRVDGNLQTNRVIRNDCSPSTPPGAEPAQIHAEIAPPQQITIPPGRHRLDITYAALSFLQPEANRYKYRLQGIDSGWVDAGRRLTASYSPIPPGSYRFEVIGSNRDGIWSTAGATMAVLVLPFFWQTWWFIGLIGLSVAAAAVGIYELRVVRLKREQLVQETFSRRLLESQETERKRIASELHDSLGQSLLVVKNYAARALTAGQVPEKVREQLHQISENASTSIEEVRSIARVLRPYQLDRFGLSKTLEDAADLVAKTGSLQIKTEIDPIDGTLAPDSEISVYRVVQEWLNNVVKHAHASTAKLQVRKENSLLRLVMEDDGVGFDYAAVMNRSGAGVSFGLLNLRERIHLLRGTLKIETAPGRGTRLSVDLPL
jgi:signal transduction histidine kinase/ligand-binding sensor domain-containing protein